MRKDLTVQDSALTSIIEQPVDYSHVLRIGPYVITRRSFEFLKSSLSDELVDACLHIATIETSNVYHVDGINATLIFTGDFERTGYLASVCLK
ncbi:hypothetical protein DPMN_184093 [Dreissena polymorpha]|uniref:Uncharacterized protein n=1 Tax=Dreissena polymorpha TaxID=45954 RepID=A0A9D4I7J9_DREPO|nr:hypothetical protein DPMN_184093 [Dreissena polymorpha]